MADWGMKVSKVGYDVKSAAIENLSMHSEHMGYTIRTSGYISKTVTAGTAQTGSAGGTFYFDNMFFGFIEVDGNGKWFQPYTVETSSGGGVKLDVYENLDKVTSINIIVTATSGTHTTKSYIILLFNETA